MSSCMNNLKPKENNKFEWSKRVHKDRITSVYTTKILISEQLCGNAIDKKKIDQKWFLGDYKIKIKGMD